MIGKWHLGSDPAGFDAGRSCPDRAPTPTRCSTPLPVRQTYTGQYVTDVITDLAIDFLQKRAAQPAVLPDGPSQGAAPAVATRRGARRAVRRAPDPRAGHVLGLVRDAHRRLHENQQRVAADLTRRDLKLEAAAGLAGAELTSWLATKPDTVTIVRDGQERDADRRGAGALEVPALHAGLSGDRPVRGRQRRPAARPISTAAASRRTRSSSTRATRGSSSAITACSTSASCTKNRCACRSWSAGRPASSAGTRSRAIALNVDFAPTFLDAAGVPVPAEMQGRSLLPVLRGRAAAGLAHVDVLPLLPRPGRPQHARALRRPHRRRTS